MDLRTLALVNKNDVSDCIETNSKIGVDQFGREKYLKRMCSAINLAKQLLKK